MNLLDNNMNLLDNIMVGELLNKSGKEGLLASMDKLVADGWQTITDSRQPYQFELVPQLRSELEAAGFTVVDKPHFKVVEYGKEVNFSVRTDRFSHDIPATDLPQDIPVVNKTFTSDLIDFLRKRNQLHVYAVTVCRLSTMGYLPPTVFVHVRTARGVKTI